jgi:hypothetical protein
MKGRCASVAWPSTRPGAGLFIRRGEIDTNKYPTHGGELKEKEINDELEIGTAGDKSARRCR